MQSNFPSSDNDSMDESITIMIDKLLNDEETETITKPVKKTQSCTTTQQMPILCLNDIPYELKTIVHPKSPWV